MNGVVLASLALSLGLTVALEAGLYLATGKRSKKDLLLLVAVNVVTNPAVVLSFLLLDSFTNWNRYAMLAPLELLAIMAEGRYYEKYGSVFRRPYLFSLAANALSFGFGELIRQYFR